MNNDPKATTISMNIGYIMLFLIDSLNVIRIQNRTVAPPAIKISVMNPIIEPTPDTIPYLAGFDAIAVAPSIDAIQKFFPLKAI